MTRGRRGEGGGEGQPRAPPYQHGALMKARSVEHDRRLPADGLPLWLPLTPALSPQAGRGGRAALVARRQQAACCLISQIQLVLLLRVRNLRHLEGTFYQRNSRTLASAAA